jgi:hypothetical protein
LCGYAIGAAGKSLGLAQVLWAILGAGVAGFVVDKVRNRFGVAGRMRLAAALTLSALPSALPQFAGNDTLAIAMLGELMFVMAIYGSTMLSVLSEIAPPSLRGFAVALYAFVMTMIGGSLGPVAVAWLTESVFSDPLAVGWSMAIVGVTAFTLSALLAFFAAARVQSLKTVTL